MCGGNDSRSLPPHIIRSGGDVASATDRNHGTHAEAIGSSPATSTAPPRNQTPALHEVKAAPLLRLTRWQPRAPGLPDLRLEGGGRPFAATAG